MMTPEEVAKSYDQIAGHWNGSGFNRDNGIAQHKRAFKFLKRKSRAIDIGCGSSGRIIDLLLGEGFETEGLDVSVEMLKLAKERHPEQMFYQTDICQWQFPKTYDFISAWDSIWHVPLIRQEEVLKKLCGALSPGGVLIFTSGGIDLPDDDQNSLMGPPMYHAALGIPKLLGCIQESNCVCRHLEYDQYPEKHIYCIAQKIA